MKICLVYPRTFLQNNSFLIPLGIVLLATIIKKQGYDVIVLDSSFDNDLKETKHKIKECRPDVVGVSASSDLYSNAKEIVNFSKTIGAITVAGGPYPTLVPEEVILDCNSLDFVVSQEAEFTFLELLNALKLGGSLDVVNGITYRKEGKVKTNSVREPISNLDELPFADREVLPTHNQYIASGVIGLMTSRGCPYNCGFCQPALNKITAKFRRRSPENVAEEITMLYKKYKKNEFHIDDETFALDKDWIKGLVEELRCRKLKGVLRFYVLSRVDSFDKEAADLFKQLGVKAVGFGVETGSQEILDALHKDITIGQIKNAFKLANVFKIKTHAFLMLGTRYETVGTLQATAELVHEIQPDSIGIALFTPQVGTFLYSELGSKELINNMPFEYFDFYQYSGNDLPCKSETLTYKQVINFRNKLLKERRLRFIINNTREVVFDFWNNRSIEQIIMRAKYFMKKRHYYG